MVDLQQVGLGHRVMGEFDAAALMIHSNIELVQWRKVVQALKLFLGIAQVYVNENR